MQIEIPDEIAVPLAAAREAYTAALAAPGAYSEDLAVRSGRARVVAATARTLAEAYEQLLTGVLLGMPLVSAVSAAIDRYSSIADDYTDFAVRDEQLAEVAQ